MIRFLAIISVASALTSPAMAEDKPVLFDVPPGVLIFDVDPAPAEPAVDSATAIAAPPPNTGVADVSDAVQPTPDVPAAVSSLTGSASASLRSASEPIVIIDAVVPQAAATVPVTIDLIPAPEPDVAPRALARTGSPRKRPTPKVDPVTGRLRDTPGWTGRTDAPASIGCFPEGACAVLNLR